MAISQAKLEANRRNARKSTGPRTEEGKASSRRNAVKHGARAETLLLLDEDPQMLEDQKAAWRACLAPRDEVEQSIVDGAVEYAWLQDRARRAQAARLATNLANAGIDQAVREADEVLRLGQKLFADKRGPLADYPHSDVDVDLTTKRVSQSDLLDDPEDPPRLVLHLQATAGGCQWMLDQWAGLRSILEDGLNWQSVDKLKAVRLLGRQPMEAVDDRTVLLIFIACLRMEGRPIDVIPEIWNELREREKTAYAERLRGRGVDRLAPADAAAARQVLFNIIDRATAQIQVKAEDHRRRAAIVDSLAADRLLFDDSPEGERLRRYELANGRAKARSLSDLLARQRLPLPVIRGPLSVVGCANESMAGVMMPTETSGGRENAPNEPTDGPLTVVRGPLLGEGWPPSEPVSSEATGGWENAPNEPTDAAAGQIDRLREWPDGAKNEHAHDAGVPALLEEGVPLQRVAAVPLESFEDALKRIRLRREEYTRQLNEQARKEAAAARDIRRARRRKQTANHRNTGARPKGRAAIGVSECKKRPFASPARGRDVLKSAEPDLPRPLPAAPEQAGARD